MKNRIFVSPGDEFGYYTVLYECEPAFTSGGSLQRQIVCKCRCGTVKPVRLKSLRSGASKSCGCYHKEIVSNQAPALTHGQRDTQLYNVWAGMKQRCLNPKSKKYPVYGGRGIAIHPEWVSSFEAFASYVGPKPDGMSLDRIDTNGDYAPGNVRWADAKQQARNRRVNCIVECGGKRMTLAEACEAFGLSYNKAQRALKTNGTFMSITRIVVETMPAQENKQ